MKKIINGKVYDTTTAELLGSWSSPGSVTNFSHFSESIYRKRTGEFFLHGEGGPASRYAVQIEQNSWRGGEKITPLSWDDARSWVESHLNSEDYERIFGPVSEDGSRVAVNLSISASSLELARRAAAQSGVSLSAYIMSLILEANKC